MVIRRSGTITGSDQERKLLEPSDRDSGIVRRLSDVRTEDAAHVGGKAASIGELIAGGARVPNGVVLSAGLSDLAPGHQRELLAAAADEVGQGPFAVRSSGVTEDGVDHSFAGVYESVLEATRDSLPAAAERVLASARAARAAAYGDGMANGRMAIIVQQMVRPAAAGVALTADPVNGDRKTCVVTAVRGLGERLVSGAARGDEWVVRDGRATARRRPEDSLDRGTAERIAAEARRIEATRGVPQDIEWAIDPAGTLWILQARPMTALPPDASWVSPAPGAYGRPFRFGEWISEPVTPLFESWLLTAMEDRLHELNREWVGQIAPRPYHVVVNGWYFYSLNFLSGGALMRSAPGIIRQLFRDARMVKVAIPQLVRSAIPVYEGRWRRDVQPRYRAAAAEAAERVESLPVAELPPLIDELAMLAGEYFASIAVVAGSAYKMEMNLSQFFVRHLRPKIGGSHLSLLAGLAEPKPPDAPAVVSLDWWHEPMPMPSSASVPAVAGHDRVIEARKAAEAAAFDALASAPRRLAKFRDLLAETQRLVPIREEQVSELTITWPTMRRAVVRTGEALVEEGVLGDPDEVFFLTRDETIAALHGGAASKSRDVAARRALRERQARLVPPLLVGRLNPLLRKLFDSYPKIFGAVPSEMALVTGAPASAGRATGLVRVVRGAHEFDTLLSGEILVAPLTAPAWTPLFARAAAVVTDVGSPAAHASIIAREFGIPAVVGCGDATARLRNGMRVTVDGSTGNVEPA